MVDSGWQIWDYKPNQYKKASVHFILRTDADNSWFWDTLVKTRGFCWFCETCGQPDVDQKAWGEQIFTCLVKTKPEHQKHAQCLTVKHNILITAASNILKYDGYVVYRPLSV